MAGEEMIEKVGQCEFADSVLQYIYGELDAALVLRFEDHLAGCHNCIEELAELSLPHHSVFEWRKLDFDPLPTPRFEIPLASTGFAVRVKEAIEGYRLWLAGGLSFAAIAIISVFVVISAIGVADQRDLAVAVEDPPVNKSASIGDIAVSENQVAVSTADSTSEPVGTPYLERGTRTQAPVSGVVRSVRSNPVAAKRPVSRKEASAYSRSVAPTLAEYDDSEDDSLRLSDLFEEIDTSD